MAPTNLPVLSAIADARAELAKDVMWVRDDLRGALLEQASEIKRLQAMVWVLAQLTADKLGVSPHDLASRIAQAVAEVGSPSSVRA
jgi:hypothetical protein